MIAKIKDSFSKLLFILKVLSIFNFVVIVFACFSPLVIKGVGEFISFGKNYDGFFVLYETYFIFFIICLGIWAVVVRYIFSLLEKVQYGLNTIDYSVKITGKSVNLKKLVGHINHYTKLPLDTFQSIRDFKNRIKIMLDQKVENTHRTTEKIENLTKDVFSAYRDIVEKFGSLEKNFLDYKLFDFTNEIYHHCTKINEDLFKVQMLSFNAIVDSNDENNLQNIDFVSIIKEIEELTQDTIKWAEKIHTVIESKDKDYVVWKERNRDHFLVVGKELGRINSKTEQFISLGHYLKNEFSSEKIEEMRNLVNGNLFDYEVDFVKFENKLICELENIRLVMKFLKDFTFHQNEYDREEKNKNDDVLRQNILSLYSVDNSTYSSKLVFA